MIISRKKLQKLQKEVKDQKEVIFVLDRLNDELISAVAKRDKQIEDLNKRLKFFGISIGTEEQESIINFPSTLKL